MADNSLLLACVHFSSLWVSVLNKKLNMQLSKTASSPERIHCSLQRWSSEKITQQGGI